MTIFKSKILFCFAPEFLRVPVPSWFCNYFLKRKIVGNFGSALLFGNFFFFGKEKKEMNGPV